MNKVDFELENKGAKVANLKNGKKASKMSSTTIKTEAQKKAGSSVAPTMLSKQWQQLLAFQVMAIVSAEGKKQNQKDLNHTALVLYEKQVKLLVKKVGYYTHIEEFKIGDITEDQMMRTKGLDNFLSGEKIWRKGKDLVCSFEKYLAMDGVRALLKKHSKVLTNLQEEKEESSPSSTSSQDVIEATFEADSGDSDGANFLNELLQISQPTDNDVQVVLAPTAITVEYLIVKYFFVFADMCGYTTRVTSERNVVVRYIFPEQVKNVSRSELEMKRKMVLAQESLAAIDGLKELKERKNEQLKDFVASLSCISNQMDMCMKSLEKFELLGFNESDKEQLKTKIRELMVTQDQLRVQYDFVKHQCNVEREELEKKRKASTDLQFSSTTQSYSKKKTPTKQRNSFMPN
jgi:hypothetical protein